MVWEKPEKLHLTLNFLGRLDDSQISAVSAQVAKICDRTTAFSSSTGFIAALYKRHEQSLVYLDLSGDLEPLIQLQKTLSLSLAQLSFSQPRRYFPHITLGKIKKSDPVTVKSQLGKIDDAHLKVTAKFAIDHLTLYESLVSDKGSTYQRIQVFPFLQS